MQMEQEPALPELFPNGVQSLLDRQSKRVIVQILDAESLNSPIGGKKYKCYISDGSVKHKAVIGNEASLVLESKQAPRNCIVRVDDVVVHKDQKTNKKLMVIIKMEILDMNTTNAVIGQPVDFYEKIELMEIETEEIKVNTFVQELESECISLDLLRPYSNFVVKVRVTSKKSMKSCRKDGASTKVFSVDLMDKDGNELTATFFGGAADLNYQIIEQNSVYLMRNGDIRKTNPKYNKNNTLYQIIFESNNSFVMKVENESDIPLRFDFTKIDIIYNTENNTDIDVVGFVESKTLPTGQNGAEIYLADDTNTLIRMKMGHIDIRQVKEGQLVIIKSAKVGFSDGQKCLVGVKGTRLLYNSKTTPAHSDVTRLIEWKQKGFRGENVPRLPKVDKANTSENEYIPCMINDLFELLREKGTAFVRLNAYVEYIGFNDYDDYDGYNRYRKRRPENCDLCGIEMFYQGQNIFGCESCGKSIERANPRQRRSARLKDSTGEIWLEVPDSFISAVVGIDEADLRAIQELDENGLNEMVQNSRNERMFLMSVDFERVEYNNKYSVNSCQVQEVPVKDKNQAVLEMLEGYRDTGF